MLHPSCVCSGLAWSLLDDSHSPSWREKSASSKTKLYLSLLIPLRAEVHLTTPNFDSDNCNCHSATWFPLPFARFPKGSQCNVWCRKQRNKLRGYLPWFSPKIFPWHYGKIVTWLLSWQLSCVIHGCCLQFRTKSVQPVNPLSAPCMCDYQDTSASTIDTTVFRRCG